MTKPTYTPSTDAIRKVYVAAPIITERNRLSDADITNNTAAFQRWLAAHDAEILEAARAPYDPGYGPEDVDLQ